MRTIEASLEDFSDKEIKDEYIERFGDPDDYSLNDFSASDLIEELEDRGKLPGSEPADALAEIVDLVAEAARTSRHAVRAYDLLRDTYPEIGSLSCRQSLIAGRMDEAA